MSTVPVPRGGSLVLGSVPWKTYLGVLRTFDDRHLRITYDRGALEIMTLSSEHERFKRLLLLLIATLVEELGWNMAGFGSMTFKRRKLKRGLEPDECYWIQSEPLVRGKDKIDVRRDPPPDLVIEIDWTHSSLNRLAIFAALGARQRRFILCRFARRTFHSDIAHSCPRITGRMLRRTIGTIISPDQYFKSICASHKMKAIVPLATIRGSPGGTQPFVPCDSDAQRAQDRP